jgi:hypothetical protein
VRATVAVRTLALVVVAVFAASSAPAAQAPFDVRELATYRLTEPVFRQFVAASRLIADATKNDPRYLTDPLFTRDVALLGDATVMAALVDARLRSEPPLAGALAEAGLGSREYTKFAITLLAARLAHGFLKAGVLQQVAPGAATENVAFVKAHEDDVTAVLDALGIVG